MACVGTTKSTHLYLIIHPPCSRQPCLPSQAWCMRSIAPEMDPHLPDRTRFYHHYLPLSWIQQQLNQARKGRGEGERPLPLGGMSITYHHTACDKLFVVP